MTGPEHLREGKRLLAQCREYGVGSDRRQSVATEANAHLLAALTAAVVVDRLPERTSWQEAADA